MMATLPSPSEFRYKLTVVQSQGGQMNHFAKTFLTISFVTVAATAQVPANIEEGLVKMGHIVDPPCTAKLYRSLMPANDITSSASPVYPGITVIRDASFGPNP